ncbi:MAG TPA: type IV pilin-like G/H family protein [Coleofasciculaceae cyanobacterium]
MTQQSDFENEPIPSEPKSSIPTVFLIIGGLGCGCFGLIVLLGIISAIAFPSLLNSGNKAKQSEAKTYVSSLIRGQQAYYLEKGSFSKSIPALGINIKPETQNYRYQIVPQAGNKSVMITAQAKNSALKSYTGAVFAIKKGGEATTVKGICETSIATTTPPAMPKLIGSGLQSVECPADSKSLIK